MEALTIATSKREEMVDITAQLADLVARKRWRDGAIHLFCQHTTCGLTINEGADPAVKADLIKFFMEIAPFRHGWAHMEGNTDAHIRASLLGASLLVPLQSGSMALGTWQHIYLYEGDGPRQRRVLVQCLKLAD